MTTFSPTILHEFAGWGVDKMPVPLAVENPAPARLRGTFNRTFIADMSYVEREEGVQDWDAADAWIAGNSKRGRMAILVLCELPDWLAGRKDRWEQFERYCTSLRDHIAGDVAYCVEAGREFDTDPHLGYRDPDAIVRLWAIVRRVFGDQRTILGSIVSLSREGEGLQRMRAAMLRYREMFGQPRAFGVHLYDTPDLWSVLDFERLLHEVRGALISCDCPLTKLWVTEFGVWRPNGKQFAEWTTKEQGAWLREAMRQQTRADAEQALFWHFDPTDRANGGFGFLNASAGATTWNQADTAVRS